MGKKLWEPSPERVSTTNMFKFMQKMNRKHGLALERYSDLYTWSVENIAQFWAEVWEAADVIDRKSTRLNSSHYS